MLFLLVLTAVPAIIKVVIILCINSSTNCLLQIISVTVRTVAASVVGHRTPGRGFESHPSVKRFSSYVSCHFLGLFNLKTCAEISENQNQNFAFIV